MTNNVNKPVWMQWSTLVCAVAVLGVAGCADRNKNDIPESPATQGEIANATDTATDAAGNATEGAADVATQAGVTGKINAAYAANASLSAIKINVDTVEDTKTVTLSGTVTNAAQKNLATNIAKQQAPGYKIVNNLTTSGGASPKMNQSN